MAKLSFTRFWRLFFNAPIILTFIVSSFKEILSIDFFNSEVFLIGAAIKSFTKSAYSLFRKYLSQIEVCIVSLSTLSGLSFFVFTSFMKVV